MKRYLQLTQRDRSGNLVPILGSFAVIILDARERISRSIEFAYSFASKSIDQPDGFEIHEGNLKNSKIIFQTELKERE